MECEDCGSDEGVETICPYDHEIRSVETECVLCSICFYERSQEI